MKYKIIVAIQLILGASFLTSCNDWLDISPRTEVLKQDVFKNQANVRDALVGVYIGLSSANLYGNQLTYGNIERLAMHWDEESSSEWAKYNYINSGLRSTFNSWYRNLYMTITNINNILAEIDDIKDIFDPGWYELIKGELLGIRAYCHLDLLRLWGPIPGTTTAGNVLPYVKTVSVNPHPHITYISYIEELENDLNEAQKLLEEWDPIISDKMSEYGNINDFWLAETRQIRMNVNAVKALKARFYLWTQKKTLANQYAMEVIKSVNPNGGRNYTLGGSSDMNSTSWDYSLSSEHIFAIENQDLYSISQTSFNKNGGYGKKRADLVRLFGGAGSLDIRLTNLWEDFSILSLGIFTTIKKYWQPESEEQRMNQMPLIRLSEMYFIAMESGTTTAATTLLEEFYSSRNLTPIAINSSSQLEELLILEYNREFYAEGQGFYAYKRLNRTEIMWTHYEGGPDIYILPMPDDEILN